MPEAKCPKTQGTSSREGHDPPPLARGPRRSGGEDHQPGPLLQEVQVTTVTARAARQGGRARPPPPAPSRFLGVRASSLQPAGLPALRRQGAAGSAFAKAQPECQSGSRTSANSPISAPREHLSDCLLGGLPSPLRLQDGVLDDLSPSGVSMATLTPPLPGCQPVAGVEARNVRWERGLCEFLHANPPNTHRQGLTDLRACTRYLAPRAFPHSPQSLLG